LTEPRLPTDKELFEAIVYDPAKFPFHPHPQLQVVAGGSKFFRHEMYASSWDRSLAADAYKKDVLQIYDRITGNVVKEIHGHDSPILAVAFSPDTKRIVTGHENDLVKVWDVESCEELATLRGHTGEVYTVCYNPDGTRIASGGNDNNIIIWDATTYEQAAVLRGHTSYVHSVCFSPDGTKLASASGDTTVRIWDSVPPAVRWKQIQRETALRREAEPIVNRLLSELGDLLDVADRIRADPGLSRDLRRAALHVLLERSAASR
jgi:WD40 repeat protein